MEKTIRKSPLNSSFIHFGYSPEVRNGYEQVYVFDGLEKEYNYLKYGVALRDLSNNTILELHGKDVIDFLHRITTNNLITLEPNSCRRTIFSTDKGRILDSVLVINFEQHQLLIGNKDPFNKISNWIEKYVIMDDVKIMKGFEPPVVLELLGPQAEGFVRLISGSDIDKLKDYQMMKLQTETSSFFIVKLEKEADVHNYLFIATLDNARKIINELYYNKGVFDFGFVGEDAYEIYRIENGIPGVNELNDNFNPHEVSLLNQVDFKKGCYIGQEVIARLDTYDKVQKYLSKVELSELDKSIHPPVELLSLDNKEAGILTSLSQYPTSKKTIGLAFIKRAYCRENEILKIQSSNGSGDITVTVKSISTLKEVKV